MPTNMGTRPTRPAVPCMPTRPNSQPNKEPIRPPGLVSGILSSAGNVSRHLAARGQATLSLDLRALSTWRVLVGLLLAYECWMWADGLDLLVHTSGKGAIMAPTDVPYTRIPHKVQHDPDTDRNAGAHDTALSWDHVAEHAFQSVAFYRGPYWLQGSLLATQLLAAVLLTLGLHTHAASVASFLLYWARVGRECPLFISGSDKIVLTLLLWTMFLPVERLWSLDALRYPTAGRGVVSQGEASHGAPTGRPQRTDRAAGAHRGAPHDASNPSLAARGERPGAGCQQHSGAGILGPGARADTSTASGHGGINGNRLFSRDLCCSAATAGFTLQVALVYLLVVINRLRPRWVPEWTPPEFSALYYALNYAHIVRPLPGKLLLALPRVVLQVLTAATMVLEIAAGALILATRADRWARALPVALLVSLHVGIMGVMPVGMHQVLGIIGAVILLPSPFWDWAGWPPGCGDGATEAGGASTDAGAGDNSTRVHGWAGAETGLDALHGCGKGKRGDNETQAREVGARAPLILYVRRPAGPGISPDVTCAEGTARPLPLLFCLVGAATLGRVSARWATGHSDGCAGRGADGPGEQVGRPGLAGMEGRHGSDDVTPPSPGSNSAGARSSKHEGQGLSIGRWQASLGRKGISTGMSSAAGTVPFGGFGNAQPGACASAHAPTRVPSALSGWWLADGKETLMGQAAARKVVSMFPGGRLLQLCPGWLHGGLAWWLTAWLDWSSTTLSRPQRYAGAQIGCQGEVAGCGELPGKVLSAVVKGEKGSVDASGKQASGRRRGQTGRLGVWCQHIRRRLVAAFMWVLFAYALLENAGNLGLIEKVDGGKLARVLNIDQNVKLFTPPSRVVRWWVVVGTVQVVGAGGKNVSVCAAGDVSMSAGSDDGANPRGSRPSQDPGQRPLQQLQHFQQQQVAASCCQWDVDLFKVLKGARKSLLRDAWCFVTRSCGHYGLDSDRQVLAGNGSSVANNGDAPVSRPKEAVQARECESIKRHVGTLWQPVADKAALFSDNVASTKGLFRNHFWKYFTYFIWRKRETEKLPSRMHHLGSSFFCNFPELLQGHVGGPDLGPGEQLVLTQVEIAVLISPVLPPTSPITRGPPSIGYREVVTCGRNGQF
eukprot:jgi/Mesvir1/14314/Mv09731-RA.1